MVSNVRRRQIKYRGPPKCAVQEYREPSQELAGLTQERLSRKNRQEAKRMARVVAREKKAEKQRRRREGRRRKQEEEEWGSSWSVKDDFLPSIHGDPTHNGTGRLHRGAKSSVRHDPATDLIYTGRFDGRVSAPL